MLRDDTTSTTVWLSMKSIDHLLQQSSDVWYVCRGLIDTPDGITASPFYTSAGRFRAFNFNRIAWSIRGYLRKKRRVKRSAHRQARKDLPHFVERGKRHSAQKRVRTRVVHHLHRR